MANSTSSGVSFSDTESSLEGYVDDLRAFRTAVENDPDLNPTAHLGFLMSRDLEAGNTSIEKLAAIAKQLSDRAFVERAKHLGRYVGADQGMSSVESRLDSLIDSTATQDDQPVAFEEYAAFWTHPRVGAVFTAHPTFGMSQDLRTIMADLAITPDAQDAVDMNKRLSALPHVPDARIELNDEHAQAQAAIERMQAALQWVGQKVLERARILWPTRWTTLDLNPLSIACWVGYDLDGRTDIGWPEMVRLKLEEKATQLERYLSQAQVVSVSTPAPEVTTVVQAIQDNQDDTHQHITGFGGAVDDPEYLSGVANALTAAALAGKAVSVDHFVDLIDEAIAVVGSPEDQIRLVLLRSEMKNLGLGTAHVHFRINGTQLHNGFVRMLELADEDGISGRMGQTRLNDLIRDVEPHNVNFSALMHEPSTAVRQFILIAQIIKHIDTRTPVRFLIAECEDSATVLVALYFARLFGVDHLVDISPLFETPSALERGVRILDQLLDNEHYLRYVRLRGRMAIQTGFSDAGRFIGQIPATLAIERLQIKLARILGNQGMEGIEVLFFNTHGESMGRGAHPGSLSDRFDYVMSRRVRHQFSRIGVPLKHETSFQGGDGYLLFENDLLARASLLGILENARTIPAGEELDFPDIQKDVFYRDTDFSLDFFLHLKSFQEHLFEDDDYRAALGSFGTNLLFTTGSRKSIRQNEIKNPSDRGNPRQMRAIPHNAIMQQLGYPAHVVSGIGEAVGDEYERFVDMCANSERATRLMGLVAHTKRLSSLNSLAAYSRLFDPGYWISRAYVGIEADHVSSFRKLAQLLMSDSRHERVMRLVHHLRQDAIDLHRILDRLSLDSGKMPDDNRLQLDLLHSIRIAIIEHIYLLGARIPEFASRHDVTQEQVMSMVLSLEIPMAVSVLREVFPMEPLEEADVSFDETSTYHATGENIGYVVLHENLIDPMEQAYEMLRQISVGISYHFLAHG
ncbi:MAG: phosphoenolpyruvate carboxylase [Rhodospirillales bacterium]|jgi:phosphoenolpyruvate carboxylase|nr:phosphoenolpyruvate carboxylase [Rhodospirillales bacterium]MBT4041128.1 phosphoenolpyruvate carboxylase [Rhodospirillales bacterium]MBT4626716.1 phosphoenolpyruvate carboxylase [Rhodospirillales bacterium]MBT5350724.1 phosphoenolpyruvate carboxylase [Rhodospirillales bacterium]MBT5519560.1 phosphoenolpyruvate carboxylase [Rhodospirillales bacterium]